MAKDKSTFIKLDRNILEWRWYKDVNTFKVFVHLLIKANVKPHDFERVTIGRGELATSYPSLAAETGLSIRNVRTALEHLKETGEVTVNRHPKFQVISIPKYDYYQTQLTGNRQSNWQSSDSQPTGNRQQYKNDKNDKNEKEYISSETPENKKYDKDEKVSYGYLFLSDSEWDELSALCPDSGRFIEIIDRVSKWLEDNPRPQAKHKALVKTFMHNDGIID